MTDSLFECQITLIKQGSKQGLKEIYNEYGTMIYTIMLSAVKNPHNAEDLTSDFFVKLWEKTADTYRFGSGHKRWLASCARNMAVDFLRREKHIEFTLDNDENSGQPQNEPADTADSESDVIGKLTVAEALKRLDPIEYEIVNLKLFSDFTLKDIAKILGKPIGTVAWKYRNAIAKLKKYVREVQNCEC